MKRSIIAASIMSLVLLLSVHPVKAGEISPARDFTLQDIQGNKISLSAYRDNHPAILFFWTTWCPFCRDELKILNEKYADLTKAGIKIIAINTGESAARVGKFIQNKQFAFDMLLDPDSVVAYGYGLIGVPTYVVISKDGVIIFRDNYFPDDLTKLLAG